MTEAQEQWKRCKPWIEQALEYTNGMYDIEDIEKAIEDGTMVFVPGEHSALILEIVSFPRGNSLNVFLGGGEKGNAMREYIEKMDACVIAFARAYSCRWITHYTRKSGERIGEKLGYRKQWAVMIKDVSN